MNYRGDFGQKRLPNLENRSDVLRQIDRKRKTERTGKNQNKNKALLETGSVDENRNLDSGAIKDHRKLPNYLIHGTFLGLTAGYSL